MDNRKYSKVVIPYKKEIFDAFFDISSYNDREESCDASELIINQIMTSAIIDKASTSVYIISSNNLYLRSNLYSANTIRHFVNKSKEHGDLFLYTGRDRISKLIARLWGFRQVKFSQK